LKVRCGTFNDLYRAKAQNKVLGVQRIQRAQNLIDSLPV
jgi:hypothetical protein